MHSNSQPLGQIITRITQERGSFADLTEESLLQEIETEAQKENAESSVLMYGANDESQPDETVDGGKELNKDEPKKDDRIIDDEAFDQVRQELLELIR